MSALELLKKVKVQTLSFEKHPCRELDQEIMIHYLNGLALITNEDETVCEKEREYLSILINSFGLNEDMLEIFINFAQNPDEKLILDMMQSFMTKDIKYNFMVDAMMIASIDGHFEDKEKAIIEQYFEMFKITKNEAKDLTHIFEKFHNQDSRALARYFNRNSYIKKELFEYLFDYYNINLEFELNKLEKEILTFEFFEPTFSSGGLGNEAKEIMTKPISNGQFFIYLNAMYNGSKIKVEDNKIYQSEDETFLMDLSNSDISFEDGFKILDENKHDWKVTGVTYIIAQLFITWLSKYLNTQYQLSTFDYNKDISMDSFEVNLINEFFYNKYTDPFYKCERDYYIGKLDYSNITTSGRESSYPTTKDFNSIDVSFRMMKS